MHADSEKGFTLVELAIVLMIIGLLIGGILRGQELMENARVNSTIQQVTAYQGAMVTFQDAYAMLPGDIPTATARVPGCNAAASCQNGDGNGLIGDGETSHLWYAIPNDITTENTQFWKHLSLAHLISGVTPSAAEPDWGSSHPIAKIGGGFFVRTKSPAPYSGRYLILRRTISGEWDCGAGSTTSMREACSISPNKAAQIDRKMDDGIALQGDVMAISAGYSSGCGFVDSGDNGPSGYAEGKDSPACDMMFRLP